MLSAQILKISAEVEVCNASLTVQELGPVQISWSKVSSIAIGNKPPKAVGTVHWTPRGSHIHILDYLSHFGSLPGCSCCQIHYSYIYIAWFIGCVLQATRATSLHEYLQIWFYALGRGQFMYVVSCSYFNCLGLNCREWKLLVQLNSNNNL